MFTSILLVINNFITTLRRGNPDGMHLFRSFNADAPTSVGAMPFLCFFCLLGQLPANSRTYDLLCFDIFFAKSLATFINATFNRDNNFKPTIITRLF